jgi:hypothetical protein
MNAIPFFVREYRLARGPLQPYSLTRFEALRTAYWVTRSYLASRRLYGSESANLFFIGKRRP